MKGKERDINKIMETIPEAWRDRWCGGENGACACMGCVQVGNRLVMAQEVTGRKFTGDPEYIDESQISKEIFDRYKINREEWKKWVKSQK
jgi:hypothetical protein